MTHVNTLKDCVAIVTGASRGIGKAIAFELASLGCNVALVSRKQEMLDAVAAEISEKYAVKTFAYACHCGKTDQVAAMVPAVADHFGGVDILVNNAATNPHFGLAVDGTPEVFRKIIDTNVIGYYSTIQAALPYLAASQHAAIVNMSSIAGLAPSPLMGLYSVSKAAVISMTRMFANELGPKNIRVNCVAPGLIKTDFSMAIWASEPILEEATKSQAIPRIGEPEEIAGLVAFLCSDKASFITGSIYTADGGATA